jgi:hypothetical protein
VSRAPGGKPSVEAPEAPEASGASGLGPDGKPSEAGVPLTETGIGVRLCKGWKETLEGNTVAMSFKEYLKAVVRKLAYIKCSQEIAGGKCYGLDSELYVLRVPRKDSLQDLCGVILSMP